MLYYFYGFIIAFSGGKRFSSESGKDISAVILFLGLLHMPNTLFTVVYMLIRFLDARQTDLSLEWQVLRQDA